MRNVGRESHANLFSATTWPVTKLHPLAGLGRDRTYRSENLMCYVPNDICSGQNSSLPYRAWQIQHATQPTCSIMKDRQCNLEVIYIIVRYATPSMFVDSYLCNCSTRLTKLLVNTGVERFLEAVIGHYIQLSLRLRSSSPSYSTCFLQ